MDEYNETERLNKISPNGIAALLESKANNEYYDTYEGRLMQRGAILLEN